MAITGAQIRSVLNSVGAGTGTVTTFDQLAAGADQAMRIAGIKTLNAAAAFMATMAQESAYFRTTTEYGSGQSYAPYIGRTFQQLTWRDNYAAFGTWCKARGLVTDASIFVNNPSALSAYQWAWLGGAYYFSAPRSWDGYRNLVEVADSGSILMVSRAVNAGNPFWTGTPNGMSERTTMYNAFRALGASIIPGNTTAPGTGGAVPAGHIPGTGAKVAAAANTVWGTDKNRYYGNAWPRLRELKVPNQPWCGHFVRWVIRKATGYDIVNWCPGYAWTPTFARKCKADPLWQEVTYANARAGDVVFFFKTAAKASTLDCYHVGQVVAGPTAAGHDMQTIEGNTSTPGLSSSMSSGGTVAKKTRSDLDTGYYRMRIWRPPYYQEAATTPTPDPEPVDEPTTPVDERPQVTTIDEVLETLTQNPVAELAVSEAFWAAARTGGQQVSQLWAYYDDQPAWPTPLPMVASQSSIKVNGGGSMVRRNGSFVIQPEHKKQADELVALLSTPGVELRCLTGYDTGGRRELVPVHTGLCDTPRWSWPSRTITVESPDLMSLVAKANFGNAINTAPWLTFAQNINFFTTETVPGSRMAILTENTDLMPSVILGAEPESRINAISEFAMAIGCELFASPVPKRFVLRPYASLTDAPQWTVAQGRNLVSRSTTVDWSPVGNLWIVRSRRADQEMVEGEYRITDPDDPLRFGGPFGMRVKTFETSLLTDREGCETTAKALCDRWIGARVNVEWEMLRNPLMEAGDRVRIIGDNTTHDLIIESFEIPLGSQNTTPATARSLADVEGVQ